MECLTCVPENDLTPAKPRWSAIWLLATSPLRTLLQRHRHPPLLRGRHLETTFNTLLPMETITLFVLTMPLCRVVESDRAATSGFVCHQLRA